MEKMKKKILFVINTLSRAGAETALLELLRRLDPQMYEISLFVLTGQGEMASDLPTYVHLLNTRYDHSSVLSSGGKRKLLLGTAGCLLRRGVGLRLSGYLLKNLALMLKNRHFAADKLMWRVWSDAAPTDSAEYDLAVAFLEGGATYYVADHVKARKKVAFVHIDYEKAGYNKALDGDCYRAFQQIFVVSDEVKQCFTKVYPELENKIRVFYNMIDQDGIRKKALAGTGFTDEYPGFRILTVGRLTQQKALEVSIDAMKLLKEKGREARWYVLGDGDQREKLQRRIKKLGLEEDFQLLGAVDNPYPYFAQTDLYVHATRYEGKSVAIQEAQTLGCAILVSDCSGNREQLTDKVDGRICQFDPESICDHILWMMDHPQERQRYARAAAKKEFSSEGQLEMLTSTLG